MHIIIILTLELTQSPGLRNINYGYTHVAMSTTTELLRMRMKWREHGTYHWREALSLVP